MAAQPLLVVGGGGFCREVVWLARECPELWRVVGILDDNPALAGQSLCDVPVLGAVEEWRRHPDAHLVVAIGSPRTRRKVVQRIKSQGEPRFATLVHPSVSMSQYVEIGEGSIVTAGCVLTTQVTLGRHSIVNLLCSVGHDVVAGEFCTLSPRVALSGNVTLGDGAEVGTGAVVVQGLTLGRGSFVGAGAVVSKDVADNSLSVGVPARHVKTLEEF